MTSLPFNEKRLRKVERDYSAGDFVVLAGLISVFLVVVLVCGFALWVMTFKPL
jgi:hypothetical protein